MDKLDYRLVGRDATAWQKKYFFHEVGRAGNPDSAFILLLASQRRHSDGAAEAPGSDVFARLVDHYGRAHLTESPRDMVRRLVDIVSAGAVDAEKSRTELAAGFLHIKGSRAAAGSVGRMRAGLADRESIVATAPLADRAGKKAGIGQVALDLGQTIEGDLEEMPGFFIAPSSAMAVGDEQLRKFLWDMVSGGSGIEVRPPADWKHLPCLVGAAAGAKPEDAAVPRPRKLVLRRAFSTVRDRGSVPRREGAETAEMIASPAAGTSPDVPSLGFRSVAGRTALWVCLIAVIAFLVIKFGIAGMSGDGPTSASLGSVEPAALPAADGGVGNDEGRAVTPVGVEAGGENVAEAEGIPERAVPAATTGGAGVQGALPPILSPVWRKEVGGTLTSSPVDLGDAVAFGSRAGLVHCLEKTDGAARWSFSGPDGFGSSPAAAGGKLFIGCYDGSVFCLSTRDGSRIWSYKTGGRIVTSPAVAADGKVFVGSYDGYLYCLSADGQVVWRFNSGARIWSSPVLRSGRAIFGDVSGRIHCLDSEGGRALWRVAAGGAVHGSPAAGDDYICFGSSDGVVASFSLADGAVRWRYKGGSGVSSSVALGQGSVFAGYEDGSFVRLSAQSGEPSWKVKLPGPVRSRPVVTNDAVVVTCYDGFVRMLDVATGTVISTYNANGKIYATPLLASDTVYFGDMSGGFTALGIVSLTPQ